MSAKDPTIPVNDRRRFDPEGNPRPAQEAASDAAPREARAEKAAPPPEVEEEAEAAPVPEKDPEVARLEQELDSSRRRVDELARAYQALNKDREDFKQRLNRERERMIDVEKGKVALALLEAIDELDLALSSAGKDESALAQGVRMIRSNLLAKTKETGIERLSVEGQTFDPNAMEAADMEMTTDEAEDQKVLAELRAGYRLNDRIIRPARVKVAKYVRPANA